MKKLILLAGAALALVGCSQGGTEDEYGTSSGTSSNYNRSAPRNENQGGATGPGGTHSSSMSATNNNLNITP